MGCLHGANRHEEIHFPKRLDDSMTAEHPVRFIDAFGDHLNLTTLGFSRATPAATGRPAYDPADLLTLYVDGSLDRLRSSRRLAQATHRHVEVRWLWKQLRPEHKTMADFRQHTLVPLRQVCRECTLLCTQRDLVALDGSTCKAVHAKARNCPPDTRTHLLPQIAQRVEGSLQAWDGQDTHEEAGTPGRAVADNWQAKLEALQQRQLLSAGVQAQWAASGEPQRSRTEPDSRAMQRGKGRGTAVCSNGQTAVDRQPTRMIANEVTHDTGDRAWRSPMALQATAVLGSTFEAVADVGSCPGEAVQACREAGSTPSVARPIASAHQKRGLFTQDDVSYAGGTDTSQCPAGEPLTCRCATVARGRPIRSEATAACNAGARTPPGTRNTGGRRLTRWGDEPLVAERAQRVRRRPEGMQQCKQWVAHPCGTMQRWWDTGSCFLRGLEKGRTACSVTVLADNLRRVVHRVERPRLMAALGCDGLGRSVVGSIRSFWRFP